MNMGNSIAAPVRYLLVPGLHAKKEHYAPALEQGKWDPEMAEVAEMEQA